MKIIIDDLELEGTPIQILEGLRKSGWGIDMTIEDYFDFMCANYHRMTGVKFSATATTFEENCKKLFDALSEINVLKYVNRE
ncbi:MAG: hypothetical protein FWD57_08775 [Polyangiaceae bacterium]|nr:hypothetical protein [Polyangiaceae bacterium]